MSTNLSRRNWYTLAVVALAVSGATAAFAASTTSNLSVTATVSANCTISTVAVAFGAYDPIVTNAAADLTGSGTVTVTCTSGSAATVTLGQGANAAGGSTDAVPLRQMASGAERLAYTLYSDAPRSVVWGNTAGTDVDHVGTGAAANLTVYGSVAAAQNVPAGAYADTVVATVNF